MKMSRQLNELQVLLQQLVVEHERLLRLLEEQQAAVKRLDMKRIGELSGQQEASRMRVGALEARRRLVVQQLALAARIEGEPTILRLADAYPQSRQALLGLRHKLRALAQAVQNRATIAGRVAGAILGHLNTVVRLISGAAEQAGLYNKQGVHSVSNRIGMMEAVG
jgi:hypothetical protein